MRGGGATGAAPPEPHRLAAVSIDLDQVHHYRSLHGLPASSAAAHAAFEVAVPRAMSWARSHGVPLTFFAVGADLARDANAAALQHAIAEGHAVESHSMTHPYDLVRLGRDRIRREVLDGFDAVERRVGRRPAGFRAPGYTLSNDVLDALEDAGAAFDSSVLPSTPYYLAKAGVLAWMRARGRHSASIVGSPRVLFAPTEPYRPARDWARPRGDRALVEIPIRVTRLLRVPVIGTTLALAGPRGGARVLVLGSGAVDTFNLELHAIDFLGVEDGLADVAARQRELRAPLARRMQSLDAAVQALRERGYGFDTVAGVAGTIALRL